MHCTSKPRSTQFAWAMSQCRRTDLNRLHNNSTGPPDPGDGVACCANLNAGMPRIGDSLVLVLSLFSGIDTNIASEPFNKLFSSPALVIWSLTRTKPECTSTCTCGTLILRPVSNKDPSATPGIDASLTTRVSAFALEIIIRVPGAVVGLCCTA